MIEFLTHLFDTTDFPPRWMCGHWSAGHGWLHILSDLGVWSAYVAIPLVLGYFLLRRQDLPFRKIFLLFGAFILACGTTHLMEAIIFWWPAYRLAGMIKLFTAIISWSTVVALVPIVPRVLAMRSPEELEREIAGRIQAEEALQRANIELERRVQERTTELTKAVSDLRDERELLRITLESIGDGVLVTDADARITFMNPVAESLTEWPTPEAQGSSLNKVFHILNEQTRQPADNPATRALRDGVVVGLANHTVLVGRQGNERAIDDSAAPIRDSRGQIVGSVLVFRDITERRIAERDKAERFTTTSLLASIVEFSEDAIIRKSLDGTIQSWNNAAVRLFGYTAAEAIGENIALVVPADRANEEQQIIDRLATGEHVSHFDTVRVRKDGRVIDVSLTISPIKDEHDQVNGASITARDISVAKVAEQRIYGLMNELKEADRRKDEFLATLAHELRNPLAPIRNSLEVMKLAKDNPAQLERSRQMMERQLGQMIRLVDDLLDISRITRNKVELRPERVELASVIQHAVEICQPLIQTYAHDFQLHLPPEPVYLQADPVRLAQIFSNLLNNACKFTSRTGSIELTAVRDEGEVVAIVRDNGIGIPREMLSKIFDMFTQLDSSLERSHGGLGIGLTLVKRLTEMHGGSVVAQSEGPGHGSSFVVRLPVARDMQFQQQLPTRFETTQSQTHRILVVDDNRDSAGSLVSLLELSGHETESAYDGIEALDRARAWRPEIILLDIGLPRMNGYDVCRAIRREPWSQDIVIVAMTGWGLEEDRRRSREAGFDGHLVKPVGYDDLSRLLDRPGKVQ